MEGVHRMKIRDLILAKALVGGGGVTPEGNQDITTLDEYNVADKATARVSTDERAKIIPANIKKDVVILGVVGSHEGGGVDIEQLDVTENGVYTAPAGKAYSPVLVAVSGDDFNLASFLGGTMTDVVVSAPSLRKSCFIDYTDMTSFTDEVLASIGQFCFSGCTGLTSFVASAFLTVLEASSFYNCSALVMIDLSHITEIKLNALYNCKKVANIGTLTVPAIGNYGAYYLANTANSPFIYNPSSSATLGDYALFYASVSEIRGAIGNVGANALSTLRNNTSASLTTINCKFEGSLGQNALSQNTAASSVDISTSEITSLGGYVFYYLGYSRSSPSSNILSLDLRNSTFETVNSYDFGYLRYTDVRLPSTVTTIANSAFYSADHLRLYLPDTSPIGLSSTGAFSGTYTIFIPYKKVIPYRSATNWSSSTIQNNVKGYAPANTFAAGDTLPGYTPQGYAITWYSDEALTTVIITCPVGSPEIYCAVASTQSKWAVSVDLQGTGTLSVVDSSSNPVDISDGGFLADTGNVFTLTAGTSEAGDMVSFKVDGVTQTSPYTLTVGSANVSVVVNGYSSQLEPDFDAATWQQLRTACDAGLASMYASYIGHTKTVTLSGGETITYRLVDTTGTCYELADGSRYAGLILEPVNCLNTKAQMNTSGTNAGGYPASHMATVTIPAFVSSLPSDVASAISEIKLVRDAGGTSGALTTLNCKAFIPAEKEVSTSRNYSLQIEFNALKTLEYYQTHTQSSDRIKQVSGANSTWWLSSSREGNSGDFCTVGANGTLSSYLASYSRGVAPCLAI